MTEGGMVVSGDLPKIIHITKGPSTASVNWCGAPSDPNWPEDPDFKFGLSLPICPDCIEVFDGDSLVLRKSTAAVTRTPTETEKKVIEDGVVTPPMVKATGIMNLIDDESLHFGETPKHSKSKREAQQIIDNVSIYKDYISQKRSLKEWAS